MVRIHPDPPGCEMAGIASQSRREAPTNKEWRSREPGAARGLDVYKGVHERPSNKAWRSERGCSSVGRAPALQAGGHRFDPVQLHQQHAGGRPSCPSNPERPQASAVVCFWSFGQSDSVVLEVRLFFNNLEEVKRTRRNIVVCWVRLYRPDLPRVLGGWVSQTPVTQCSALWDQATKCMWWMPWRSQAMKDVAACVKPRGAGKRALIRGCPNGETRPARVTAT